MLVPEGTLYRGFTVILEKLAVSSVERIFLKNSKYSKNFILSFFYQAV
jgi:hypothetical protein